ncbi:MAG: hypothetical protein CVU09_10730 [Bacteroidetes bacterium HGW-Bacteroidetes-4]|jgi:hypothetical protein|nr:MAG: hypothetical protein CVU09_10730 [Bacteroidetes bacterium HGW-Bacteroidetes-4]
MERIKENPVFESFKNHEILDLTQLKGGETVRTGCGYYNDTQVEEHLSITENGYEVWYSKDGNEYP